METSQASGQFRVPAGKKSNNGNNNKPANIRAASFTLESFVDIPYCLLHLVELLNWG